MVSRADTYVTAEELDTALPHILAAPTDQGDIFMLCRRSGFAARDFAERLEVTPHGGVSGDRAMTHPWLRQADGTADPSIQVCILPTRVFSVVCDRPGAPHPGDTIIADLNMSEANLPNGTHLQVGSALLEVSSVFNPGCVKWKARYGDASFDWINRPEHVPLRLRGVLCRVVRAGAFSQSDRIVPIRPAVADAPGQNQTPFAKE